MRAVVVTGAAGAIGTACCRRLFKTFSCQVVIGVDARLSDPARKRALLDELDLPNGGDGPRFVAVDQVGDFMEEDAVNEAVGAALHEHVGDTGLDALIAVAGGNPPGTSNVSYAPAGLTPNELFDAQFKFNFQSTANVVRVCMPELTKAGGSVVLTSSVNGTLGIGETAYAVSKAGLHALARNVATAHGGYGVTANAVALGTVYSPNIWGPALDEDPDVLTKIGSRNPRNQVGTAEEAAAVLCFLGSPDAKLINGQVITADGGWGIAAGTVNHTGGSNRWFD